MIHRARPQFLDRVVVRAESLRRSRLESTPASSWLAPDYRSSSSSRICG
jgi:hypothetical protein